MNTKLYNTSAAEVGTIELNSVVFEQEYNEALIHQVVVAQMANKRQGTKSTLTRAEVRGGGCKPWKQKGTGRARQGSIRSPQWIKGGVVFAPKPRDFSKKVNVKMKEGALKSALSAKVADGNFTVVDKIELSAPKTKEMAKILNNFSFDRKTLLIVTSSNEAVLRASRNIENLTLVDADLINVYDLVANVNCLITADAVKRIEEVYA